MTMTDDVLDDTASLLEDVNGLGGLDDYERDFERPCVRLDKRTNSFCTDFLPVGANDQQKYCPRHQPRSSRLKARIKPPDAPQPKSVTNNIKVTIPKGATKKDNTDAERVEQAALAMLQMLPMLLAMTGDEICPPAISEQLPAIAAALGELSKFQPWLKKVFTPGESTGEVFAWVSLLVATSPALIVVLSHHGMISADLSERLRNVFDNVALP
jgi:hypothetical protein